MRFIKENGGVLVIVGIVATVLAAYGEWRIGAAVQAKFAEQGIVSLDRVVAIESDIEETREIHVSDRDRMDGKIERIVDILLED